MPPYAHKHVLQTVCTFQMQPHIWLWHCSAPLYPSSPSPLESPPYHREDWIEVYNIIPIVWVWLTEREREGKLTLSMKTDRCPRALFVHPVLILSCPIHIYVETVTYFTLDTSYIGCSHTHTHTLYNVYLVLCTHLHTTINLVQAQLYLLRCSNVSVHYCL